MDQQRFDDLTRALATGTSRRRMLRGLTGGVLGGVLGLAGLQEASAACRVIDQKCDANNPCCKGAKCANRHCVCKTAAGYEACLGPGSRCINTNTDEAHCGACFTPCPPTATCVDGACVCPNGTTPCNGQCVNTLTDENNCGSCGYICPDRGVCAEGGCFCPTPSYYCQNVDVCCGPGQACSTTSPTGCCAYFPDNPCSTASPCCRPNDTCSSTTGLCCTNPGDYCYSPGQCCSGVCTSNSCA